LPDSTAVPPSRLTSSHQASAPIGVFDSGIGGLTVLKELRRLLPYENFVYIGDTARVPYGSKSPELIRKYSEEMMLELQKKSVKAIVIACNSASSQISESEFQNIPLFNVIDPGIQRALAATQTQIIGLIGTRATIQSQVYQTKIKCINPQLNLLSQPCPLFVPLVEEGWFDDPVTNLICYRYLQNLKESDMDVLILGCTHYSLLKEALHKVVGKHVTLVDAGTELGQTLIGQMKIGALPIHPHNFEKRQGHLEIYTTDRSLVTLHLAQRILEEDSLRIEQLDFGMKRSSL